MYHSSLFLTAALMGTTVVLVQPLAVAKTLSELQLIAQGMTVEIRLQQNKSVGSGIIIKRQDNLYTLVTNAHVVCGNEICAELPAKEIYSLNLADGQKYQVKSTNIKLLKNDLDLAIIQFRSSRNYAVAKISAPGSLKVTDKVYTAGFPYKESGLLFGYGEALAVVNKRLTGDNGGYTIIYSAPTLPGMSGGGVFNGNGQLVAIHGYGDRFRENTDTDNRSRVDGKIGYNRGIPVQWLVQSLSEIGISLGGEQLVTNIRATKPQLPTSADEYFITGFNKYVNPENDVQASKKLAIQDFSNAIRLNPKYVTAYFVRAIIYGQLQEFQRCLSDYNQAIALNPKYAEAYNNRANLKKDNLNDYQGAMADYNQAIKADPRLPEAYNNRGLLKYTKFNDFRGALADYNQGISLNPRLSGLFFNRALLKEDKLNDFQGALADYNRAISLNPQYFAAYYNRSTLKQEKLKDNQGALADLNQAISINPKFARAYHDRGLLKYPSLQDAAGALADYNQAIKFDPQLSGAYNNRAILKITKLNDQQGALADFNQAIKLQPKYADAYRNRAVLKYTQLNDKAGGVQDMRQAAKLFRQQGRTQDLQNALKALKEAGATE
jgi:tetratricopeptide (TPR) repeat protein